MKSPARLVVAASVSLTLAAATLLAFPGVIPGGPGGGAKAGENRKGGAEAVARKTTWKEVERLESEQKLEEARLLVEGIRKIARISPILWGFVVAIKSLMESP